MLDDEISSLLKLSVAQNSFQHLSRLRFSYVVISYISIKNTVYQSILESWYEEKCPTDHHPD